MRGVLIRADLNLLIKTWNMNYFSKTPLRLVRCSSRMVLAPREINDDPRARERQIE